MYNYIIKKGGKEKINNGIKARTKHCLSRGKDVGLTEKRGAYAFFYFFLKNTSHYNNFNRSWYKMSSLFL